MLRATCGVVFCHVAACAPSVRAPVSTSDPVAWDYEVELRQDQRLDVTATFRNPGGRGLAIEPGAERFVEDLGILQGDVFIQVPWGDRRTQLFCQRGCTVHYGFRLGDAARGLANVDLAIAAGGALLAPPSTWLVRPASFPEQGRYRFQVMVPKGALFATGVRHARGDIPNRFEAPTASFEESNYAGFGAMEVRRLAAPNVDLIIAPGLRIPDDSIARWASTELEIVSRYFGRSPSDSAAIFVVPGTSGAMRGKTLGGGGASIFIRVGTAVTEATLSDDWVLCHELIHVGFPSMERGQTWFSEGLATYVEPVIRARAGLVSKENFWADLVEGLPQGLPASGDRGLENNDAWGRVYWGGALYFLLADLAIRERTSGAHTFDDAVRAVVAAKGNVESFSYLSDVIDIGDRATGTQVLRELYERLARAPGTEDLDALWKRLGVVPDGKTVRFDDGAPAAALRDAISAPRSGA